MPNPNEQSGFDDSMPATFQRLTKAYLSGAVVTCFATDIGRALDEIDRLRLILRAIVSQAGGEVMIDPVVFDQTSTESILQFFSDEARGKLVIRGQNQGLDGNHGKLSA